MPNDDEVDARQEDRKEETGLEVWGRPCTAGRTCASSPLSFMVGCVLYVFNVPLFIIEIGPVPICHSSHHLGGSPVILWISLGAKWLPLKFGYHVVMRTSPIALQVLLCFQKNAVITYTFSLATSYHHQFKSGGAAPLLYFFQNLIPIFLSAQWRKDWNCEWLPEDESERQLWM